GNVSAPAAAFGATALTSHKAALARVQLKPLAVLRGRSCYHDMKAPPEGGQVSAGTENGCSGGLSYFAALRNGAPPARNCSRKAVSSALAAARWRCLTGPNPPNFSWIIASSTARP